MGQPAYANTYTYSYTRTHSIVFLSDNLRNTLREVIRENGLDPSNLMQDWETIERGIRAWLQSRHLYNVVVEFYRPGASAASARWDFPVGYDGSGVDDDMWLDKAYLRQLIAKAAAADERLQISDRALHARWRTGGLGFHRLHFLVHGIAGRAPGGHRDCDWSSDGGRDVLEVGRCFRPRRRSRSSGSGWS